MNYELAKQLKDAGFPNNPFRKKEMCPCSGATVETHGTWVCRCKEFIQEPTLSELIEACGDRSFILEKYKDYKTRELVYSVKYRQYKFISALPEEAVANLWLELNKK